MFGRSEGGMAAARASRSGSRARGARLLALGLAASGSLVATGGTTLAAGSGGLSYPPALLTSVPDAGDTGDGVASGNVLCPSGHPHPTGGGVNIDGSDPNLDLEVKSTGPSVLENGWDVQANNSSGSDAQMTISAICSSSQVV